MTSNEMTEHLAQLEAAIELVADEEAFFVWNDKGKPAIAANCNDTFGYAEADCEEIPWEEVVALNERRKQKGWPAVIEWVAERRGQRPIKEIQESIDKWNKLTEDLAARDATIAELQKELHAEAVCDCHVWPTVNEFHSYTIALEKAYIKVKAVLEQNEIF